MSVSVPAPIDVFVLTGFLGAGKTTLLNRILTADSGRKIAVLVNEFGEIGIDQVILLASQSQTVALSNGCLCCRIAGDLAARILQVCATHDNIDTLVIELSGLDDPSLVLEALHADLRLIQALRLRGVIAMVDAKHALHQIAATKQMRIQIAVADKLVLNKTDLVSEREIEAVEAAVAQINPHAPIIRARDAALDIRALLDPEALSRVHRPTSRARSSKHADACSFSLELGGALDGLKFGAWLRDLTNRSSTLR